jgi:capsular polysaccharide transport system permease protein
MGASGSGASFETMTANTLRHWRNAPSAIAGHAQVIWALMLRELGTRYGRDNIGFLWVIGEPLLFCLTVMGLWTVIRPPYEHGIRIIPFVMTGYMPILLMRHMVQHTLNSVKANSGLLYHRRISILHLFVARLTLEFVGVSLAFLAVFLVLFAFGLVTTPSNLGLVYGGWLLLAWVTFGLATIVGALSELTDFVERFVSALTYILVPLSGTFFMAEWVPPRYREIALTVPFLHCIEMIRGGFFGEFVHSYYSVSYVVGWAAILTLTGLVLLRFVRAKVQVD